MDAEKMLETQREVALKHVEDRNCSQVSRQFAYGMYLGKIQAVWFLGLISDDRYEELCNEWKKHDPLWD